MLVLAADDATRLRWAAICVGIMTAADAAPIMNPLKMAITAATRFTVPILQVRSSRPGVDPHRVARGGYTDNPVTTRG